jgi:hypothetical protein
LLTSAQVLNLSCRLTCCRMLVCTSLGSWDQSNWCGGPCNLQSKVASK